MSHLKRPPRWKPGERIAIQLYGEPANQLAALMKHTKARSTVTANYLIGICTVLYAHITKPGAKIILRDGKGHEEELKLL